jgi:hypothetical protein
MNTTGKRSRGLRHVILLALLTCIAVTASPARAQNHNGVALAGARGVVKSSKGDLLEGMMVQLIAQKSAIRTTVYSNEDGRYEFPALAPGTYTLRIAQPREFSPYVRENVQITGAVELDDIVLSRVTNADRLPPSPEVAAQMTGSEWLASLSGTGDEKRLLTVNCNWCHSYQQIFRNRYDEAGWARIIDRMTNGAGSPLINMRPRGRFRDEDTARLVKWLATVRGPDSMDPPFVTLPRPQGRQTRAVITEYELPRLELATHDVSGDSRGNVWYSTHRSSYIGRLDPRTGEVTFRARARACFPARIGFTWTRATSYGAPRTGATTSIGSTPGPATSSAFPGRSRRK